MPDVPPADGVGGTALSTAGDIVRGGGSVSGVGVSVVAAPDVTAGGAVATEAGGAGGIAPGGGNGTAVIAFGSGADAGDGAMAEGPTGNGATGKGATGKGATGEGGIAA